MQRVKYKDGISIIVTLYNKEEYILQTLNSATNQFQESEKYQSEKESSDPAQVKLRGLNYEVLKEIYL